MADKIFPTGIRCFSKHQNAPAFVVGSLVITPNKFFEWMKANANLLTEYNGDKQLKLQILSNDKGLYVQVDTYVKGETPAASQPMSMQNDFQQPAKSKDDLPF